MYSLHTIMMTDFILGSQALEVPERDTTTRHYNLQHDTTTRHYTATPLMRHHKATPWCDSVSPIELRARIRNDLRVMSAGWARARMSLTAHSGTVPGWPAYHFAMHHPHNLNLTPCHRSNHVCGSGVDHSTVTTCV